MALSGCRQTGRLITDVAAHLLRRMYEKRGFDSARYSNDNMGKSKTKQTG